MSAAVEVEGLVRRFGAVEAVGGVSFTVPQGQVLGVIGPNGAGKTTTLRILATLDAPTAGRARVCGHDLADAPERVRARLGYMPDAFGAYAHTTVAEYLDFFARAYGLLGAARRARVAEIVEFTELGPLSERDVATLSKGQSQRLSLARALVNDPEVMLLDEPAAGLDPKARVEFKRLVRLLAAEGKTLLISSHILSELEEMCDQLLFVVAGRIVHHGSAAQLRERASRAVEVVVQAVSGPDSIRACVGGLPGIEELAILPQGLRLGFESAAPDFLAATLRRLIEAGVPVHEFRREERRLDEAFVDVLRAEGGE